MEEKVQHILLVDDEEAHTELACEALDYGDGRYRVTIAGDLATARELLAGGDVDLAIVDWSLPDGRGSTLLPGSLELASLPMIVMTSHGDERVAVEAMKAGALDYIVKSSDRLGDLGQVVERTLRQWKHISDRRRVERELHESEARMRTLVENIPGVSYRCTYDEHWTMEFVSDEIQRVTGYPASDFIGNRVRSWASLTHPDDVGSGGAVDAAIAEGSPFAVEYRIIHADGDILWVFDKGQGVFDKSGVLQWVDGVILDITQLKQAEQERQTYSRSLAYAQQIAHLGSWDWNIAEGSERWSDEQYRIYGYTPGVVEPEECRFLNSVHPEDVERVSAALGAAIDDGAPYEIEFRIVRPDQTERIVFAQGEVGRDSRDRPVRMVGTMLDVTERRQEERAREQFTERIQQAQKLESLGVMAGGIAHDFNNILQAILGSAELTLETMSPESASVKPIRDIMTAARRAADLTDQMLAYSGSGGLNTSAVNLSALVQEMAQLLEISHSKNVVVRYLFDSALPAIKGDPAQLRQVAMNLITNASEAIGEEAGVITVETGVVETSQEDLAQAFSPEDLPEGTYVFLRVTDTGCGMDEEAQRRIFEPFYTTKFTGRGLGMAAVLGILRAHKGAIDIDSEPGSGTSIKVLLPALQTMAPPIAEDLPREMDWSAAGTVLVVDDEEAIRRLMKVVLERKGFSVLTAADGEEATSLFREHKDAIVCVLLDLTMPRMGGGETFVELQHIRQDVPVLLVSGYGEKQLEEHVRDLGFAGFLKKPVYGKDLLRGVHDALVSGPQPL